MKEHLLPYLPSLVHIIFVLNLIYNLFICISLIFLIYILSCLFLVPYYCYLSILYLIPEKIFITSGCFKISPSSIS